MSALLKKIARVEAAVEALRAEVSKSTPSNNGSNVGDMEHLTSLAVARMLGVSRCTVHNLDHVLTPRRSETGVRIYDRAVVEAELERRKAGR